MTDTRKEFEEWFKKETPTFRENEFTAPIKNKFRKAWQACQQLNDKRIADLEATIRNMAAVIEKKDLYLGKIATELVSIDKAEDAALEALALTADGVELVEVGIAEFNKPDGTVNLDIDNIELDGVHKLYTIKQKGKQDGD